MCSPAAVYVISSKVTVPSAAFLAVATTFSPSLSSNSYLSASRALPSKTLVALIVAFVSAALYVLVKVGLLSVTVATSSPAPLSTTATVTLCVVVSYVTPFSLPSFSVIV